MSSLASLVDELGEIEAELLPFKAKIKRAEALRAAIRGVHKDAPADKSLELRGDKWIAFLGACGNESVVNRPKLLEMIGLEKFVELATVSIKAVTENCDASVRGLAISTQMSGSRALSLMPIPASIPTKKPAAKRAKTA